MDLTPAQERVLQKVREKGVLQLNGLASRTVRALEAAGHITVEFDLVPHAKGGGLTFTSRYTIRPVEKDDS